MSDIEKEPRFCQHIQKGEARVYARLDGPDYVLFVCCRCENDAAPYLNGMHEITDRLKGLATKSQPT